jgi:hypothetical protein
MAELHASSFDAKWFGRATWSTAMPTEKQLGAAEMRARALSRWENEGGSLIPTGAADSIDESELRILARLGAALLDEWGALPRAVQGNVIRRAKTLGRPGDHAHVKGKLARFLHKNRSEC